MAGKRLKLMSKLDVQARELAVRKLLHGYFRQWKHLLRSKRRLFAKIVGKPAALAFICYFFTNETDWMDIFAACINKNLIKPNRAKNFTIAIESGIKTQIKRILFAWRNWTN